jgi:DNA-binding response OmpR family regulator
MKVLKMKILSEPLEILLVEDNKGDIGLITEFFIDSKIRTNLHIAEDGEEAIQFLCGKDQFLGYPLPDIIILDWNLPKKDGSEVLREIKENSNLKNTPVIILTTSSAEKDMIMAYDLHANAYLVKPIDFDEFMKVIKSIEDFWFKAVTLPPKHSH